MRDTSAIALAIGVPAYMALLALSELGLLPGGINMTPVSLVIPVLAVPAGITDREHEAAGPSVFLALAVWGAFAVALGTRLGLTLAHDVPLGYDAGLYKHVFDVYANALPDVAELQLPDWIKTIYPQGLPMLVTTLATALHVDSYNVARFGLLVVSALLVFPIYFVGGKYQFHFGKFMQQCIQNILIIGPGASGHHNIRFFGKGLDFRY